MYAVLMGSNIRPTHLFTVNSVEALTRIWFRRKLLNNRTIKRLESQERMVHGKGSRS